MMLQTLRELLAEFPGELQVKIRASDDGDEGIEDGDYLIVYNERSVTMEYNTVVIVADKEYDEEEEGENTD